MIGMQAVFSFFAAATVFDAWRRHSHQKDGDGAQTLPSIPGLPQT
jgi:hypothetical protein